MHYDVDNSLDYNPQNVQLYAAIHEYFEARYSYHTISKILHCSRNTVAKYLEGAYDSLCRRNFRSEMINFMIISSKTYLQVHADKTFIIVLFQKYTLESRQQRMMYGRCGKELLSAKLMCSSSLTNG